MSTPPEPKPAVQTHGLTRLYGSMVALSNLDLTVNQGDLFGFIGSNGAGKTTTLRILATFLSPSGGTASILGNDVVKEADAVRHIIGYMPDFFGVYKDMEVTEYLDFFGACYKIPSSKREQTVNDVLELVGLSEKRGALIGALTDALLHPEECRARAAQAATGIEGRRPGPFHLQPTPHHPIELGPLEEQRSDLT